MDCHEYTSGACDFLLLDRGINGKVDIQISLCYDPDARGFKNLPEDGCGGVDDIVSNFKKMGATFDGVFNRSEGSSCTCGENGCNLLSKLCGENLTYFSILVYIEFSLLINKYHYIIGKITQTART